EREAERPLNPHGRRRSGTRAADAARAKTRALSRARRSSRHACAARRNTPGETARERGTSPRSTWPCSSPPSVGARAVPFDDTPTLLVSACAAEEASPMIPAAPYGTLEVHNQL